MSKATDYLAKLDQEARAKQETFMNNIAERLGRKRCTEAPIHPFRGAPDFWKQVEMSLEERIQLFSENWTKVGGEVCRVPNMKAAEEYIREKIRSMEARYLLCWDQEEVVSMGLDSETGVELTVWNPIRKEELLTKAAGTDIGIGVIDYGVAHTGSIVALSGPSKGRSVSLLPTAFIAIIKAETIKTKLGEVMMEVSEINRNGAMPAGVHFITGPSRSADIENDLTIGVHGPGIMYAIIVE